MQARAAYSHRAGDCYLMADYRAVRSRILQETGELEQVVARCQSIWDQFQATNDERYIDGVAFNLQAFYTGIERVFERIIREFEEDLPSSAYWHQVLLNLAATEGRNQRPAIISQTTRNELDRYRGFRHVARNVYGFDLDGGQIALLMQHLRSTFESVKKDFSRFAEHLTQLETDNDEAV